LAASAVTISYFAPDLDEPIGGIRAIYRHVAALRRGGLAAVVLHEREPFRCTWFENDVPIEYAFPRQPSRRERQRPILETLRAFEPADVLVLPETLGPGLLDWAPGTPKVVFNQNAYYTFDRYPVDIDRGSVPYLHPDVRGAIVVSEDSRRYLERAFQELPVHRVHYGLDADRFAPREKRRRIAYMPRKNERDATQVLLMLRLRGALEGWELTEIEGRSEAEVARLLGESAVFLSFGHPEGFGLPAAEAMLAGALLVGYHGLGGRELFRPELTHPVEFGDVVAYVEAVESVLRRLDEEPEATAAQAAAAREFVRETYTPEREQRELLAVWSELLER
jgi:glycosyltransferase involved in cell wall biosynthesis